MIFGKAINKYYIQNIGYLIIGLIALIATDYFQLEIPILIGKLFDGLAGELELEFPNGFFFSDALTIIYSMLFYVGIIIAGRYLWRVMLIGTSRRIDYGMRSDLYKHCSSLDQEFYNEHKTGGLMAYFANDIEAVRRSVAFGMVVFVDIVFLGVLVLRKMIMIDLRLTLITAIPLALVTLISALLASSMRSKFKVSQKAFEDLSDYTNESLSGINVVKAFVKENLVLKGFLKRNKQTKDSNVAYVKVQQRLEIIVHTFIGLIYVVIIVAGGLNIQYGTGSYTIGDQMAFVTLFGTLIWPMRAIAVMITMTSSGYGSLQRINEILEVEPKVVDVNVKDITSIEGNIEFKGLDFTYPDDSKAILKDVSFIIKKGTTAGIVGRTGSGKSTIMDILLRIYNVDENKVLLDNEDIMNIPLKTVRDSIAYVPQDGFLFSDTICNNISFTKEDLCNVDEVIGAAKLSDVHDNIIEFTDGYETVIGERGVTLSGGQKQRISIARALLKDAPILILDDSVSAVDTKTEKAILDNLEKIRKDKTTIIIAHRISTLQKVDQIIIVDEGSILDVGTHDELLERCEYYKELVQRQQLEEMLGGELYE